MNQENPISGSFGDEDQQAQETRRGLDTVIEHLLEAAREDDALRQALRRLAQQVLERTQPQEAAAAAAEPAAPRDARAAEADVASLTSPPTERELRLIGAAAPQPPPITGPTLSRPPRAPTTRSEPSWEVAEVADDELPLIEQRCRLKAEAAQWAATRQRWEADGCDFATDIRPRDRDLIDRARALPDCFLWMCHPDGPSPRDPSLWEQIAAAFTASANALALVQSSIEHKERFRDLFEQSLSLLAEAQSALRSAVAAISDRDDTDQSRIHRWLKRITSEQGVFIRRHMRADDPADPAALPEVEQRIEQLHAHLTQRHQAQRQRRSNLQRVEYHLRRLSEGTAVNPDHDWQVVVGTVDNLVSDGLPPSDARLRELLLPHVERMPDFDSVPQNFDLVMREIDRYLSTRPSADPDRTPAAPSPQVARVRKLLEGKAMVMIGGDRRPESQRNLKQAFGLSELYWDHTAPHQPLSVFEPTIARPEVAVVLLAIRWSSHAYGSLKEICDRLGKPLVRLPGGYGVNRVASDILDQCSAQLQGAAQ